LNDEDEGDAEHNDSGVAGKTPGQEPQLARHRGRSLR